MDLKDLGYKSCHVSDKGQEIEAAADTFAVGYKKFLDIAKTERLAVKEIVAIAEKSGFIPFNFNKTICLSAGDKVYFVNKNKSVILAKIGWDSLNNGATITAAHIDSPRLDLKVNPIYESDEIAYFKTHYYGGIKKYQWTTIPLAMVGAVILKDSTTVDINIGNNPEDPVFYITDLLPHLAQDQMGKDGYSLIEGEQLNVIGCTRKASSDKEDNLVKANLLKLLNEKYGMTEKSFLSAEIELVPALSAHDAGLDRSLVAAYGQDDRVCAYTTLKAFLDADNEKTTTICILTDKEEIGSMGNTGLRSNYFEYFFDAVIEKRKADKSLAYMNSRCLSADVNSAYDPTFSDVFECNNASFINHGVAVTKYTGSRGKSGASDANAEFVAEVQQAFDKADVSWQIGELGKVDKGGGGTVALYLAALGMDVLDVGVPVLSMHAPYELTAKNDIYQAYKAYKAFFENYETEI